MSSLASLDAYACRKCTIQQENARQRADNERYWKARAEQEANEKRRERNEIVSRNNAQLLNFTWTKSVVIYPALTYQRYMIIIDVAQKLAVKYLPIDIPAMLREGLNADGSGWVGEPTVKEVNEREIAKLGQTLFMEFYNLRSADMTRETASNYFAVVKTARAYAAAATKAYQDFFIDEFLERVMDSNGQYFRTDTAEGRDAQYTKTYKSTHVSITPQYTSRRYQLYFSGDVEILP